MMDTLHLKRIIFHQVYRSVVESFEGDIGNNNNVFQEHEDSLSREGLGLNVSGEAASESADAEINEDLLDEDEDEEDEERSWKRRNNGEE